MISVFRMAAVTLSVVGALAASAFVFPPAVPPAHDPAGGSGNARHGREVYERYCIQCHGDKGDGNGEAANWTVPRPRDFRQGLFKFRSTPLGALPLERDLDHTISDGLYGTSMPPFQAIEPSARQDVIAYIESLSPRWQSEQRATPVDVPAETPLTIESATRGHEKFVALCASCHGDGTGNGPLAKSLVDAWGYPIQPANLTLGRTKQEVTGRDIYRTFMTGINGTPMPGFAGAVPPADAWDIVHFIESLGPWKGSTKALRAVGEAQWPSGLGPKVGGGTPASDVAGGTAAPATGATIAVKMIGDASGYHFEPAHITVHTGDAVTFTNMVGGPHNVTFWGDSIPKGTAQQLQANMPNTSGPLTGPLLIDANATFTISFGKLPAGTYKFYCLPHLALGMKGEIVVQ
jgi:plastocyanin